MAYRQFRAALLLAVAAVFCMASAASADDYVRGHYRANGTYVKPYVRSSRNDTAADNYSTEGNTNPHTLKPGYKKIYDPHR